MGNITTPGGIGEIPMPHVTHIILQLLLIREVIDSGSAENLSSGSPQRHHPHNSIMDNIIGPAETLTEAAGHGLLRGKIRKAQLYPST